VAFVFVGWPVVFCDASCGGDFLVQIPTWVRSGMAGTFDTGSMEIARSPYDI
jgi:hypothetical protein